MCLRLTGKLLDSRILHSTRGGGVEVRLSGANALRFDACQILWVEAGRSLGTFGAVSYTLGALVEKHASFTAGLAHYFGQQFQATTGPESARLPRNEATLSFALQTQPHLGVWIDSSPEQCEALGYGCGLCWPEDGLRMGRTRECAKRVS